jgi:beta-galactosidase/beta-glucuronidase
MHSHNMPEEPYSGPDNPEYPRPQLRRREWMSLNGRWDFATDESAAIASAADVEWRDSIVVPFAPETSASGIAQTHLFRRCWYRRSFAVPPCRNGERLLLHFGAVDYRATVWVNGQLAVQHEGGYTPFSADITPLVSASAASIVVVRADDDPLELAKPRGKQDWQREPHSIWYPRTTGIWQTVWLERVPRAWISAVRWTPNLERWELAAAVALDGDLTAAARLRVVLRSGPQLLADDTYLLTGDEIHRRIVLADPGIDDYRNELLWNPDSPRLIQAELTLLQPDGTTLDAVSSYTALRSVAVDGNRVVLNGRPYYLRMVLDQGYWPGTGMTAPDSSALRRDVELAKAMGFNGVRKHQKIEDPRYLYWADRLGLLVWEEMPSAYRFTRDSIHRTTQQWMDVLARDASHPCIIAWVPFNESWGVPNLPMSPTERHYVHALYNLTKTLDPTRPVVGNDGWESIATDIVGIHDYDPNPDRIAGRYLGDDILPRLFKRERPGGRLLVLEGDRHVDQPLILSEFGGITLAADETTWGYSRAATSEALATHYTALLAAVRSRGVLSGFCYTQFADTYQEANGLLYADRRPKFSIEAIRRATRGD